MSYDKKSSNNTPYSHALLTVSNVYYLRVHRLSLNKINSLICHGKDSRVWHLLIHISDVIYLEDDKYGI